VPSLHLAVAPVGSVLPALAAGAAAAGAGFTVTGAVAGAAAGVGKVEGAGVAAGAAAEADAACCMPPWLLQAPRPVAVDVVPSLQVVGGVASAARQESVHASISNGAAMRTAGLFLIIEVHSVVGL
jgi:hypothetical protein